MTAPSQMVLRLALAGLTLVSACGAPHDGSALMTERDFTIDRISGDGLSSVDERVRKTCVEFSGTNETHNVAAWKPVEVQRITTDADFYRVLEASPVEVYNGIDGATRAGLLRKIGRKTNAFYYAVGRTYVHDVQMKKGPKLKAAYPAPQNDADARKFVSECGDKYADGVTTGRTFVAIYEVELKSDKEEALALAAGVDLVKIAELAKDKPTQIFVHARGFRAMADITTLAAAVDFAKSLPALPEAEPMASLTVHYGEMGNLDGMGQVAALGLSSRQSVFERDLAVRDYFRRQVASVAYVLKYPEQFAKQVNVPALGIQDSLEYMKSVNHDAGKALAAVETTVKACLDIVSKCEAAAPVTLQVIMPKWDPAFVFPTPPPPPTPFPPPPIY